MKVAYICVNTSKITCKPENESEHQGGEMGDL